MVRTIAAVRSRRRQRGASVLIVFLVMAMLTGIGMFAARSSTLSTAVAGSSKQLMQTRYVSEYAIVSGVSRDPAAYVNQMTKYVALPNDPKCFGAAPVLNATCFSVGYKQVETDMGVPLILPADVPNKVPGGLGLANVDADFNVDITELSPALTPVAGAALNAGMSNLNYFSVTLTARGQVRAQVLAANMQQSLASSSVQSWRAHVVVGPLPNPAARPPAN